MIDMKIKKTIAFYLALIRYRYAVSLADRAHARRLTRFFVLPNEHGRLIVIDRQGFRAYKRHGQIVRSATVADLKRDCIYCTATAGESEALTPEQAEFKKRVYLYGVKRAVR